METMLGKMMEGCMKGMPEEERQRIIEKMAAMCPCTGHDLSDEARKEIQEKRMSFCGSKMEMLSACFSKGRSGADQACCGKGAPAQKI